MSLQQLKTAILPAATLGVIGGGQLGRMFIQSAQAMGYAVWVLEPDADCPAAQLANHHICAAYDDPAALELMAEHCQAITTEFENVPADVLRWLGERVPVAPSADAVAIAQNRIVEKTFIEQGGVAVAPYAVIRTEADLKRAETRDELFPAILKTARMGYDGKGQISVKSAADLAAAWNDLQQVECVLEKRLPLKFEVSALLARSWDGAVVHYALAQNVHRNGVLHTSSVPAPNADMDLTVRAQDAAAKIAQSMNYVGVLCVEFFILEDGSLVANEMAPRPHNSGHYTQNACLTSQFEQQVRALAGLPLGATFQHSPAVMLNVLGDVWFNHQGQQRNPDWFGVLSHVDSFLHLYGKAQPRHARKMGHVNFLGKSLEKAAERCELAMSALVGLAGGVHD
ncbi:5-(carboxyamino)imidazole ribonucleotide synthase [Hydromonas duriensis]|uniref:N5-carboxyaminoimidazole ribonucleotide synthase n=1 Tax=Hydromonas duriensis TaxID=1527608 RepID=A0A4R6Y9N5_9BURK|nr:5-(carboxyamino)imidazole ribonucleotide synthase [Hydromonas duriensis]TDR32174.1 5-(carboxyamino)imidazole ribonucleotide synthase [Hydromonas duriensis]